MKKQIVSMLCGAAAIALAVPAFAAIDIAGSFRVQGVMENVQATSGTFLSPGMNTERPNRKWVSQRVRVKVTDKVNDYVAVIWHGEIDTDWGLNNPNTAGADGAQSADGVNIETKWMYATVKVPGDLNIVILAGIQEAMDGIQFAYLRDDVAALIAACKFGNVNLNIGWGKLQEAMSTGTASTANLNLNDDHDVYMVQVGVMPAEGMKLGAELYWNHIQGGTAAANTEGYASDLYTLAFTGAAKVGVVNLDGFFAFQNGKYNIDHPTSEMDVNAFGCSLAAGMKFNDKLSGNARVIYFGQDKSSDDIQSWQGNNGALFFMGSNMPIFLANAKKTGSIGGFTDLLAYNEAINKGYGLLALVINADYVTGPYFFKGTVGYFQAITDKVNAESTRSRKGTHLGYEFALQAGMKVADAATVSFRGSYALLGNFFDDMSVNNDGKIVDPDNMYTAAVELEIPFN